MTRAARRARTQRRAAPASDAPPPAARPDVLATLAPWLGPAVIALAGIAALAWTWRTWPDPLIDYGREVYLAWQIAKGRMLYADLAHFNGPFSAYFNGLVFWAFGRGILVLALANAVLAAACVAMLYQLLVRTADRVAATLAGLTFVVLFACARYVRLGNYNWLCAYSYELPHGVMLGVATLWCLDRYHRTRRIGWMAAVGGALGLVALTKAEALLAGAFAVATGLALTLVSERPTRARLVRLGVAFGAGLLVPLASTFLFFVRRMPVADVLAWPLGYWHAASRPEFVAMPFYREGLGTDDVAGNVWKLVVATTGALGVLALGVAAAFGVRQLPRPGAVAVGLGVLIGGVAWAGLPFAAWVAAPRALPVLMLIVVGGSVVRWWRMRREPGCAERAALRAALAVLALVLLAKLGLNARIIHYGFALAMPATLVVVTAMVTWVPGIVGRAGGDGRAARAIAVGMLAAWAAVHVGIIDQVVARQTATLGEGADLLFADDRAAPLRSALAEIRRRVGRDQTLVAFPEGVMLNYLARRASSVPYVQYSPVSVLLWGEARIEQDLALHPPDFVLLVHRENAHEGARFFGRDYAQSVMRWVEANYRPVWKIGAPPLQDDRFGLVLMERVPQSP